MADRSEPGQRRLVLMDDGRLLEVFEYGDPRGVPVVAHHGTPASARSFAPWDEPATELGVRVLAVDRPGVGGSTRNPGYTVADVARDTDALLRRLDIERAAVAGWSGGGPYALACVSVAPERVRRYALVAGMGPLSWPEANVLNGLDKLGFGLSGSAPQVVSAVVSTMARVLPALPDRVTGSMMDEMPEVDRRAAEQAGASFADIFGAYRQSGIGAADDYRALGADWYLDLPAITVPGRAYQGLEDTVVVPEVARHFARIIPTLELVEVPEAGHLVAYAKATDILTWLRDG